MNNQVNWMQQGWECPKCGAVMSPHTDCCVNCRGNKGGGIATTITDVTKIDVDWTKQQTSTVPSSIYSTDSSESVVYGKEDSKKQWDRYLAKSMTIGNPNPIFDASGCPPELSFDNSGYKINGKIN